MNKSGMVQRLMVLQRMTKEDATVVVESLLDGMREALLQGDEVVLMNIGTLQPKPQTKTSRISFGKEIQIKRGIKISFRPSKNLESPLPEKQITGDSVIEALKNLGQTK